MKVFIIIAVLAYIASCEKSESCNQCLVREGCSFCLSDCLITMDQDCRECASHRCKNCFSVCTVSSYNSFLHNLGLEIYYAD